MKKQGIIVTLALVSFILPACNKKEAAAPAAGNGASAAPAVVPEAKMRATYGIAAQLPSSTEGLVSLFQLGKVWQDLSTSKTWASIRSNPLISKELDDAFSKAETDEDFLKWRAITGDAFGNESFIAFGQGTGARLKTWLALNEDVRVQQYKTALGGNPFDTQKNMMLAVMPYLKTLEIPPMIIGFKFTSQKAAFLAELQKGEEAMKNDMPPGIAITAFDLAPNQPFKSIVVESGKLIPPILQLQLKASIAQMEPDQKKAEDAFQGLISRRVEIAYGFAGDYFIISLGTDHSHLKFTANYAESLLSRPEVAVASAYADKPVLGFSWSGTELLAATQRQLQLMNYFSGLKEQLAVKTSAENLAKLETDLKRLDQEGKAIFTSDFAPMVGITYRENGLRGEAFGGLKPNGGGGALKFTGAPTDTTFLWVDEATNPASSDLIRAYLEDFVSSAYDDFQHMALPSMGPQEQQQFGMFQQIAVPKIIEFYHISRDQFAKSLGQESAISLDLNGAIPELPMVPPPITTNGRAPRLAFLSDVRDRPLLAQSWASYFKLATDLSVYLPPNSLAMFGGKLPDPKNEVVDGVSLSYFEMPMPTGDLLPNVAVTDKTFVASTSRSYSLELSKAIATQPPGKPLLLDCRINFKAALDFTGKWVTLAGQYPDLFFKDNITEAAEFKKNEASIIALLHSLSAIESMNVRVFEENGLRRTSSEIRWNEH